MSEIWYTATRKFDPSIGGDWISYFNWANIPQLEEVISLDPTHRPQELCQLVDADWEYNIHKDYLTTYFRDLAYLIERFAGKLDVVNILAVCLEPSSDVLETFKDDRFVFQGYDLVGKGDVSAITNCGGFDKAFQAKDISKVGLFDSYRFAREVQKRLRQHYPFEPHAKCELWTIWKMISNTSPP
jgi:hypothetical protein